MDREKQFRAWLVRMFGEAEADQIERDEKRRAAFSASIGLPENIGPPHKYWRWLAVHEEHHAPRVSEEVEQFCAEMQVRIAHRDRGTR